MLLQPYHQHRHQLQSGDTSQDSEVWYYLCTSGAESCKQGVSWPGSFGPECPYCKQNGKPHYRNSRDQARSDKHTRGPEVNGHSDIDGQPVEKCLWPSYHLDDSFLHQHQHPQLHEYIRCPYCNYPYYTPGKTCPNSLNEGYGSRQGGRLKWTCKGGFFFGLDHLVEIMGLDINNGKIHA